MKKIIALLLLVGTAWCQAKQIVYVYFKTNADPQYYYLEKDRFYKELFGKDFDVILVRSLKKLGHFDYLITDEVPLLDQELSYLATYPKEKVLLFSFEPPLSQIRSQDREYHHYYSTIFTWNDDLVDNITYFKVRFPWVMDPRPMLKDRVPFADKKLCVLVAGNIDFPLPISNYGARKKLIQFFEALGTQELDLYGYGWAGERFACYKGPVPFTNNEDKQYKKIMLLNKYKFDICYENAKDLNGWVSERIFEAFAAGIVPVYWGAKNVEDYVPSSCFIARSDFATDEELYMYLKTMSEQRYQQYIDAIHQYLTPELMYRLSTVYYITSIRSVLGLK